MPGKFIAVEGCIFELSKGTAAKIEITSPPNDSVKINGLKAYCGKLSISIAGFTSEAIDSASGSGTGVIVPTAVNVGSGTDKVMRQDDVSAPITINGVKGLSPAKDTVTVKIKDAGQKIVMAV